jgi:hypothetical protein
MKSDERRSRGREAEARRKARRDEQQRRLDELAIGQRRLTLIARMLTLVLAVPMAVLTMFGVAHAGDGWIPVLALGALGAQRPRS